MTLFILRDGEDGVCRAARHWREKILHKIRRAILIESFGSRSSSIFPIPHLEIIGARLGSIKTATTTRKTTVGQWNDRVRETDCA